MGHLHIERTKWVFQETYGIKDVPRVANARNQERRGSSRWVAPRPTLASAHNVFTPCEHVEAIKSTVLFVWIMVTSRGALRVSPVRPESSTSSTTPQTTSWSEP